MSSNIYFFIYYTRSLKEVESDISFIKPEKKSEFPECIYSKENYDGKDNKKFIAIRRYIGLLNQPKKEKMKINTISNFKLVMINM